MMVENELVRWYVVQILTRWSSVELLDAQGNVRAGIAEDATTDGSVGFLPVFEDMGAAERWLDGREAKVMTIRPAQEQETAQL